MDFSTYLSKLNITSNEIIENQFKTYFDYLVEYNSKVNLTAITDEEGVYLKHFYDSLVLSLSFDFTKNIKLCDVGAGAGFPSIPNAICFKNLDVTIIDALNKRITFLNSLVQKLGISNVCALHERAEEHAQKNRESYDVVTARAVARLNVLAELCMPLVRVGGFFLAMKSADTQDEIEEARVAIKKLGGQIEKVIETKLPNDLGVRTVLLIKKVGHTPIQFPRSFAKIKQKPL